MGTTVNLADLSAMEGNPIRNKTNEIWKSALDNLIDPASQMTEDERKQYEAKITAKMKSGKHLTTEEMNYLKVHNPVLYRTAMRVELAKQRLKEQLKHCKSKEEANDVISGAINGISDKDPDKEYIVAGIQETAKNYRKDSAYARLPETREKSKKCRCKSYDFDDEEDEKREFTPISEILDSLPKFEVLQ